MKKILVTIAVVVLGISSTFAKETSTIDPRIISAFEKEFSFAQNVKWQTKDDLIQVSFLVNDQAITAWYNSDAELVITAKNILYRQLPISVIRALDKEYPGASFFGVIEVIRNNEVHYQVTVETKKKTLVIKTTPTGSIYYKQKIK